MALSAIALLTVPQAREALGIPASDQDEQVEYVINEASALAENTYCMRPLKQRMVSNLRVESPPGRRLYPELWPIAQGFGVTVSVNGTTQTVWASESDGDPDLKDVQVYEDHFYRSVGWNANGKTERNVVLTYVGGYGTVPDDLVTAMKELVQKMWGPLTQQRPDFASMAGPGGSLQTLDGQWAGTTGAGPWSLSRRTKEVFAYYRYKGVG